MLLSTKEIYRGRVVRLNVESRGDAGLVAARRAEIEALLTG